MNAEARAYAFSFVWPVALLLLAALRVIPPKSRRAAFAPLLLVAIGVALIPVRGIALGRWLTGVNANFSLPLLALLASAISRLAFRLDLLRQEGTRAALSFSLGAGIVLYPAALGWGRVDPYLAGWGFSWLFAVTGTLCALLLWRGNRFGIVLLCAIAAHHLRLQESDNYWDCLVDPASFLTALVLLLPRVFRLRFQATR
jgi:hypothetical protein